uniref:Uncharacterized protein n=1 Tax=Arundo donax TaxID=35708 RepID=A0A0A9BGV1_ARUDO
MGKLLLFPGFEHLGMRGAFVLFILRFGRFRVLCGAPAQMLLVPIDSG